MNAGLYRIVFQGNSAQPVAVPELARARGAGRSGVRAGSRARGLVALAAVLTPLAAALADALPPPTTLPQGGQVVSGTATISQPGAAQMLIDQSSARAVIDWQGFSVGHQATVTFNHQTGASAATLNRVIGNEVSVINGALNAQGQVYLLNSQGILFGPNAQINVGGLVASALNISNDVFQKGLTSLVVDPSPTANPEGTRPGAAFFWEGNRAGFESVKVEVQEGARIRTANGGRVLMFAPQVVNQGRIESPEGQTILGAGAKVYLTAPLDSALRGFLIEVDPFTDGSGTVGGKVVNKAAAAWTESSGGALVDRVYQIVARRGNVTLAGFEVEQGGRILATSSVDQNGSITLQGRDTWTRNEVRELPGGQRVAIPLAERTGTVKLGGASETSVLPETVAARSRPGDLTARAETDILPLVDSTRAITDDQSLFTPLVSVTGRFLQVDDGARLIAPGGRISFLARESVLDGTVRGFQIISDPSTGPSDTYDNRGVRVYVGRNVRMDVSGERDVALSVARNVIEVDLRGPELKDAPLQRNGILRNARVFLDLRTTPGIVDTAGFRGQVQRGVGERLSTGGEIVLKSEGDVVVRDGARLDVSGGWLDYAAARVGVTQLRAGGRGVDFADAAADRIYDAIVNTTRTEAGYREGRDAGVVQLTGGRVALDGSLAGAAVAGLRQQELATAPLGGKLLIGGAGFTYSNLRVAATGAAVLPESFAPTGGIGRDLTLPVSLFGPGRFTRLEAGTFGTLAQDAGTTLNLGPGGSLGLTGATATLAGSILAPSGVLSVDATGALTVTSTARLSTAGLWTNDREAARTGKPFGVVALGGGAITLRGTEVTAAAGSVLDVSAGLAYGVTGTYRYGSAGSIALSTRVLSSGEGAISVSGLTVAGTLRGFGFGRHLNSSGGALALQVSFLTFGGDPDPVARRTQLQGLVGSGLIGPDALWTDADRTAGRARPGEVRLTQLWDADGFSRYTLTAADGVVVAPGAVLAPVAAYRVATAAAPGLAGADSVAGPAAIVSSAGFPDRTPLASLALGSSRSDAGLSVVSVHAGATLDAGVSGSVVLTARNRIFIDGTVRALAGQIQVALPSASTEEIYDPVRKIFLADGARLDVSGTRLLDSVSRADGDGRMLPGGTISLDAANGMLVTRPGSLLSARGAAGELAISAMASGATVTLPGQRIASDGGRIRLAGREGLLLAGGLELAGGAPSARGGTLEVSFVPVGLFAVDADQTAQGITALLLGDHNIQVSLRALDGLAAATPAGPMARERIGKGAVLHAPLVASGAGSIVLTARERIEFLGDGTGTAGQTLKLAPARELRLEAFNLFAEAGLGVDLGAAYVALGPRSRPAETSLKAASGGTGALTVSATTIDLVGDLALQGIGAVGLTATEDLRLRGVPTSSAQGPILAGSLAAIADVSVTARSVQPATLVSYAMNLGTGMLTVTGSGVPVPVLSAAGALRVEARRISQGGALLAPHGSITLKATEFLALGPGAVTSVSGAGQEIPYGRTALSGRTYVFTVEGSDRPVEVPEKRIDLAAPDLRLQAQSVLDISGGGTLRAWEFLPGTGGSKDILDPAVAANRYAILPGFGSTVAPQDEQAMAGFGLQTGTRLRFDRPVPGLLAAGDHTLLPARYALLPGALVVTLSPGQLDTLPAKAARPEDGSVLALGRLVTPTADGSGTADARSFQVQVAGRDWALARSEFRLTTPEAFAGVGATRSGADAGALVVDAGNAAPGGNSTLLFQAQVQAQAATGGRGASLDLSANRLVVLGPGRTAAAGFASVDLTALRAVGAGSVLLGGLRQAQGADIVLNARATDVVIDTAGGASLDLPEVLVTARGSLTVRAGSVIAPSGAAPARAYRTLGDGALLRASGGPQASLVRSDVVRAAGVLTVEAGAQIRATSVTLDATAATAVAAGVLDFSGAPAAGGALSIGAPRVSVGAAPSGTAGVVLGPAELAALDRVGELRLRSYTTVDFHAPSADVTLGSTGLRILGIDAAGIVGYGGAGRTARLQAGEVRLSNTAGTGLSDALRQDLTPGAGALRVSAGTVALDNGAAAFGTSGFATNTLEATREITGTGTASLAAAGDLVLRSPRMVGGTAARTSVSATGILTTEASGAATGAVTGFGSRWRLEAASVVHGGRIEAPSGSIELVATSGDVRLLSGSVLSAPGIVKRFDTVDVAAVAGDVNLKSLTGSVKADAGSRIEVNGVGDADAGRLSVSAVTGGATLAGTLAGAAVDGRAGRFTLDAAAIEGFPVLITSLRTGGFTQAVDIRQRSGNLALAAGDTVQAREIRLAADNGRVDLLGTLDASGPKGGRIEVFAGNGGAAGAGTLLVGATGKLLARATEALVFADGTKGEGGTVVLGVGGTRNVADAQATAQDQASRLILLAGSVIDVSTAPVGAGGAAERAARPWEATPRGGEVILRAPRVETGLSPNNPDDIAITSRDDGVVSGTLAGTISGADRIVLEAVQVSRFGTGGATLTGGTSATSTLNTIRTATLNFMGTLASNVNTYARAAAIETRLGVDGDARYHLRPGIEIWSQGDITLPQDWDLRSTNTQSNSFFWRYGATAAGTPGEPGVLTLRAAGRVTLNGSLSDGFNAAAGSTNAFPSISRTANLVQGTDSLVFAATEGDSWSYRLTGGADLGAANPMAVLDAAGLTGRAGRVELASNNLVRTGPGFIEVAAATSFAMGVSSTTGDPVAGATAALYAAGLGDRPNNHAPVGPGIAEGRNQFISAGGFTGASAPRYPLRGGDIRVVTGGDVQGTGGNRWVGDWLFRVGAVDADGKLQSASNNSGYFRPTWWPQFQYFSHGIGAFGGGDVTVTAGGSIRNLGVASGTSGRLPGADGAAPVAGDLKVLGGGDVTVLAEGNVLTSAFHAGRGDILVRAAGDIASGRTVSEKPVYSIVSVGEGDARVEAGGSLALAAVFNATLAPQSANNATNAARRSYFSTLAGDSRVSLVARGGTLTLDNGGTVPIGSGFGVSGTGTDAAGFSLYPGRLRAAALAGDIQIGGAMAMVPAAGGQLDLLAAGSLASAGRINMSALPVSELPTAATPVTEFGQKLGTITGADYFSRNAYGATSPHQGATEPVRLIAQGGDIRGPGGSIFLQLPKRFLIQAAGSLTGGWIAGQHLSASDWSVVSAGKDIVYDATASNLTLQIGGPGTLFVTAGGSVDLGPSRGIVSRGNFNNPYLPEQGADVIVMAGAKEVRYDNLLFRYTDPAVRPLPASVGTPYNTWVLDGMRAQALAGQLSDAEVRAAYLALKATDPAAAPIPVAGVNAADGSALPAMRATLSSRAGSGSFGLAEARAAYGVRRASTSAPETLPDTVRAAYDDFVLAFMRDWTGNAALALAEARAGYLALRRTDAAAAGNAATGDVLFRYSDPAAAKLPEAAIAGFDAGLLSALRTATGNAALTPRQARMEFLLFGNTDPTQPASLLRDRRQFFLTDPTAALLPDAEVSAYNDALVSALATPGAGPLTVAQARTRIATALERPTLPPGVSTPGKETGATEETVASPLRQAASALEAVYNARLLAAARQQTGNAALDLAGARTLYAGALPAPQTTVAGFLESASGSLEPGLRDLYFRDLKEAGLRGASNNRVSDYRAGDFATLDLFPGSPGSLADAALARENISLYRSQIKSEQGGGLDLLVPGGFVNVGVTELVSTKSASELGVLTTRGGSVRAAVAGDFQVNTSRVFTLQGGDISLWSSYGSIDAGRGARTTSATPPPQIILRGDQIILDTSASVAGAGIGTLLAREDVAPGSVYLFAPRGAIEASDAPIRSANTVVVGAQAIRGADNIFAVGGVTLSVVAVSVVAPPPPPPPANAGADAAKAVERTTEKAAASTAAPAFKPSFITVQVLALGDDDERKGGAQ